MCLPVVVRLLPSATSDPPVDWSRAGTKTNTTSVPCMSEADSLADSATKLGLTRRRLAGYLVLCWTSETLPGGHACLTNTATRQQAAFRPWRAETTPARQTSSSSERTCRIKTTGPQPGEHRRRWPWVVRSRAKRHKKRVEQTSRAGTSAPRTHAADAGWSDGGRPAENAGCWRRPVKHQNTETPRRVGQETRARAVGGGAPSEAAADYPTPPARMRHRAGRLGAVGVRGGCNPRGPVDASELLPRTP